MATVDALKLIKYNPQNPGSNGDIDKFWRQAKLLKVTSVNCQDVVEYFRGEQA